MKARNLGRLELLAWLNDFAETDYPKIEKCSDGVGYAQIFDAIHPNSVALHKLNFNVKYEEDNIRNLKLVDDCLKKLKINKIVPINRLAKGKFQDNIEFLQWCYGYAQKHAPNVPSHYSGYQRRVDSITRQNAHRAHKVEMAPHLQPNKRIDPALKMIESKVRSSSLHNQIPPNGEREKLNEQRQAQLQDLVSSLESELTHQLLGYKLLIEDIEQIEEERNFYFNKLKSIENLCESNYSSEVAKTVMELLMEVPDDFEERT